MEANADLVIINSADENVRQVLIFMIFTSSINIYDLLHLTAKRGVPWSPTFCFSALD